MTQAYPVPDVHARGRLSVEHMTSRTISLFGPDDRDDQIELRAGIDYPADATKNSIHFSECSKSIDVNRLQAGGLRQQFFVGHDDDTPHWTNQNSGTCPSQLSSLLHSTVKNLIGFQFSGPAPAEFAPAFDALNPPPVEAGAINLESRSESNQRQNRNGCGHRPRKTIYHRNGLRVGEASAGLPTTSELMDVTAGETAPNSGVLHG